MIIVSTKTMENTNGCNNNNDNNNDINNNQLPKVVSTRVGKEVECPYLKKCPNMVCVTYSL